MVRSLGLIKASFLSAKRYKIDWYGSLAWPLLVLIPLILLYVFNKKALEGFMNIIGIRNFSAYLIIGIAYWNYVEALWSSVFALRYYMAVGQPEEILLMPVGYVSYIISWSFFALVRVTMESLPLLILALSISAMYITPSGLILSTLAFFLSFLASFGMVFLIFGFTLRFKEGDEIVSLLGNAAPLIGGLFFPVSILPNPLKYLSFPLPFMWGIDLIRKGLLDAKTLMDWKVELLILGLMSAAYLLTGYFVLKILEKQARRRGLQGF